MDITLDVTELRQFEEAMERSPGVFRVELEESADVALHEGIGYAQENLSTRGDGDLAASIVVIEGPAADGGSYGSTLVYAWQREEGGTIYPRNGEVLAFQWAEAVTADNPEGWVFAKRVTQEGSHYMQKSVDAMEPRLEPIYQRAIDRTLGAI